MKWALEMAVEGDFSAGFYLKTAGENGSFLHWSDSTGLAMWPRNEGLSEEEHSGLLWGLELIQNSINGLRTANIILHLAQGH